MTLAVKRTALPLQDLLELIFGVQSMLMEVNVDNSAALAVGQSGISKQLKYMAKHKKIRVGFVKEVFSEQNRGRILEKVATDENVADTLTKALDRKKHEYLTRAYGMCSKEEWDNMALVAQLAKTNDDLEMIRTIFKPWEPKT